MKYVARAALVVAALTLGACAESLAGLGGSIVSGIGGGISDSYEEKKAAIAEWKVLRKRLITKRLVLMETQADVLIANPDTRKAGMKLLLKVLKEHDKNQPLYIVQKLYRKYKDGETKPTP